MRPGQSGRGALGAAASKWPDRFVRGRKSGRTPGSGLSHCRKVMSLTELGHNQEKSVV